MKTLPYIILFMLNSAWAAPALLPGVPTPIHPAVPINPVVPHHAVMPHPIFPHPVMPNPIFPHPVMPPINPFNPSGPFPPFNPFSPMPGPVIPNAGACPHSLNVELINTLNLGQMLIKAPSEPAQFTLGVNGEVSNTENIQVLNARPASYLIEGPPGTVVTIEFDNIVTSTLGISNLVTNLPQNQCTLNVNGLCVFAVGASFNFPAHLNLGDGQLGLEIPISLTCNNLVLQ